MYLGDYEDVEGGLGKLKLKKIVKSATKAAGQVAKVAVAPAALVAASTANAVGLRHVGNKIINKTALSKKIAKAEIKASQAGGYVVDAIGAVVAAPYIAAGATTAAHAAGAAGAKGLLLAKSLQSKGGSLFSGLLGKLKGAKKTVDQVKADIAADTTAPSPGGEPAPVPGESSSSFSTMPGGSPGGAPGGGASAAPSGDSSDASDAQPPADGTTPPAKPIPKWLLFAPALLLL